MVFKKEMLHRANTDLFKITPIPIPIPIFKSTNSYTNWPGKSRLKLIGGF